MKTYKNYKKNMWNRKQFAEKGATKIKIRGGKVVSYINSKGELVEPGAQDKK